MLNLITNIEHDTCHDWYNHLHKGNLFIYYDDKFTRLVSSIDESLFEKTNDIFLNVEHDVYNDWYKHSHKCITNVHLLWWYDW